MPATPTLSLRDLDPTDVIEEYQRRRLDQVSDAVLVELAAAILSEPRIDAPDSFVLHAPLELLARSALLPHVTPQTRPAARQRIVWLAATFAASGAPADLPELEVHPPPTELVEQLKGAIAAGDLDLAGALGRHLGRTVDPLDLAELVGDMIVPSLAAAAHGPIFLHLLPRVAPRSPLAGAMFGAMAREVARNAELTLTWMDGERAPSRSITEALASTPVLGPPGSNFIFPLMHQAESSGLAEQLAGASVGPVVDVPRAAVDLQRIATASMLLDDRDQAPYGWSHCLTIPQAVASIAPRLRDPGRAVAVAATHVIGFRAGLGVEPLDQLDRSVGEAGLVSQLPDVPTVQDAIDHAAVHPDAHLAKYVNACLDAARTDPEGTPQHLAAAGQLSAWWRQVSVTDDPLLATNV